MKKGPLPLHLHVRVNDSARLYMDHLCVLGNKQSVENISYKPYFSTDTSIAVGKNSKLCFCRWQIYTHWSISSNLIIQNFGTYQYNVKLKCYHWAIKCCCLPSVTFLWNTSLKNATYTRGCVVNYSVHHKLHTINFNI